MGLLAPRPRRGGCETPCCTGLRFAKIHRGSLRDLVPYKKGALPLFETPPKGDGSRDFASRRSIEDRCATSQPPLDSPLIWVGVFGCSSDVQGGGVYIKPLVLWRLTFSFAGRPSAEVFVTTRGFMTIPPFGRSCNVKAFLLCLTA